MRIARKRFKPQPIVIKFRYNELIKAPTVRVIGAKGEHVGVMSISDALKKAEEMERDLVEINPNVDPPVVKITEYGQFKYQKDKEDRLQKKKQKETEVKGVRLSLRIGEHDRQMRMDQAKGFFDDGNKVKIELIMRGREKAFVPQAIAVVNHFIDDMKKEVPLRVEQATAKQENKITALIAKD